MTALAFVRYCIYFFCILPAFPPVNFCVISFLCLLLPPLPVPPTPSSGVCVKFFSGDIYLPIPLTLPVCFPSKRNRASTKKVPFVSSLCYRLLPLQFTRTPSLGRSLNQTNKRTCGGRRLDSLCSSSGRDLDSSFRFWLRLFGFQSLHRPFFSPSPFRHSGFFILRRSLCFSLAAYPAEYIVL